MQKAQRTNAVASLFPPGVVAFETRGIVTPDVLLEAERECVVRAVDKRIREFAAGRLCARSGLAELGFAPAPLLAGADRVPLWPQGSLGSISHTDQYCVAVVALQGNIAAVGVDVERIGGLGTALWPSVLRPEERAWVSALEEDVRAQSATIIFSAKEAFYKCQYALTGEWLNFDDVAVEVGVDSFEVTLVKQGALVSRSALSCAGRFLIDGNTIVTGIAIPNGARPP